MALTAAARYAAGLGLVLALGPMGAAAQTAAPDFSGVWTTGIQPFEPVPEGGPGPIQNIWPYRFVQQLQNFGPNLDNPILQPWALMRVYEQTLLEHRGVDAGTGQQTCRPSGVPNILQLNDLVQILQRPEQITILYSRGSQFRMIYLNQRHPENLKPSWYGHSVGHWEGDTLVVDTVKQNDKTWTDRYATPHTEQIHVVERYQLVDGGPNNTKRIRVRFTVTDPGAFTTPWQGMMHYRVARGPLEEQVCAENNRDLDEEIRHLVPKATYRYPF